MSAQPWIESLELAGQKVLLRPVSPADVQPSFDLIHGCDAITDWLVWDGPETPDDIAPYYATWPQRDEAAPGCNYQLAIVDRADGRFSGSISLRFGGHEFIGDVGYWLAQEKWGRGLVTEALAMVVWLAFEKTGAVLLHAECFEGNEGSRIVLERNGFALEPAGARQVEKKGRRITAHFYALSLNDWLRRERPGEPHEARVQMGQGSP